MLKRLPYRRLKWVCSSCQQTQKRGLAGLATAAAQPLPAFMTSKPSPSQTDEDTLRSIFDSEPFWKQFSKRSFYNPSKPTGLLQNKYFTSPHGFQRFALDALDRCRALVAHLNAASTPQEYKNFPRDFDRLSDQLCRVIDSVEFIRNVHPDPTIQHAASEAHMMMFEYMNVLNTHKGLYDQLKKASETREAVDQWTSEEKATTDILLKDFGQSAIDKSDHVRRKFVELSNEILQTGSEMLDGMSPRTSQLTFDSTKLKGMDPVAVSQITRFGTSTVPTTGRHAVWALKTVDDPDLRQQLYTAGRTASKQSIHRVEHLLNLRAELARLCGYESFAHMALSDKMARTPEAVNKFLQALASDNNPHVQADLSELQQLKRAHVASEQPSEVSIKAWDRAYYTQRLRSRLYPFAQNPDHLSNFFSVGTVMQGLSRLFTRLFGVKLVPKETPPGETWDNDVRRLDVIDETDGHIAVLYCDLFSRPNKSPNPAHFTLRCSREISQQEIAEAAPALPPNPSLADLSNALNDGMALNFNPQTGTLHQLPTIAFICDFARPQPNSSRPTLLTFAQVCTLFHEMGHALHSMLGRTKLQNVAGTRCATDFAELPSILMEYFATSPTVLSTYARHWETGQPLNVDLVSEHFESNRRLLASQETEAQIIFSVLDQAYHSPLVNSQQPWESTSIYHDVYNSPTYSSVPEPAGTSWQGFFSHLFGYGAVYYSYLFDRAIAGRVWQDVFEDAPLARERGEKYKNEVLRWGGGRDGWACVSGVLGDKYAWMQNGGPDAMGQVGKWGVGAGGEAGAYL